jgi:hypothetical protein
MSSNNHMEKPRFIKKKPQHQVTTADTQEGTHFTRTYHATDQSFDEGMHKKPSSPKLNVNLEEEEFLINRMIDDLKRQKLAQQ